ncbi:hypothetical protein GMOD_00007953 [Pyrenophora seminiperda CCB06]|uniref:Uncharacterized protein n=1 Tax=Pyrenophora seminiperda CCB06 TaxID=1302712 RepID=A0A3M7MGG3_9PLEO|nr:hypothetical protein GMOD_00007953 [Pyrenophora seminiperda CCB06]
MVIFGGLELIAGGYLIHRHYKKKDEKKRLEQQNAQNNGRNNMFPGGNYAKPQQMWHLEQANHHAQHQQQQPAITPHKYAYYAPVVPQPLPPPQPCEPLAEPPQAQIEQQFQQPRPHAPPHTQSFSIARRPVPQSKPQVIFQPGLHRTDSFATLSRMPIADGIRPQNVSEESSPVSPVAGQSNISPPRHGPYGNAGFAMSTPAFGATPTSPGLTYEMAGEQAYSAGHTAGHDWETYRYDHGHGHQRPPYAPTVSTELGEYEGPPPPPYKP